MKGFVKKRDVRLRTLSYVFSEYLKIESNTKTQKKKCLDVSNKYQNELLNQKGLLFRQFLKLIEN